jgi:hypothetical protein
MIPNKSPLAELLPPPEPEPKLDGTDVNPLYVLAYELLFPQINVAVLIPKPPPPIGPKFEFTSVKPLKSTVPEADITTFEPTSLIVTTIGADADVGDAVGVIVGVEVGVGVDVPVLVTLGVGVLVLFGVDSGVPVGVGVGVPVVVTLGVGVGVIPNVALGVGVGVGVPVVVTLGVGVGVIPNVALGVGVMPPPPLLPLPIFKPLSNIIPINFYILISVSCFSIIKFSCN